MNHCIPYHAVQPVQPVIAVSKLRPRGMRRWFRFPRVPPGVQCTALQCSEVQCSAVQCSAVQCSAVQCSAVSHYCQITFSLFQHSLVSAMQCSAVRCSALHDNVVQCSSVRCRALQGNVVQFREVQITGIYYLVEDWWYLKI